MLVMSVVVVATKQVIAFRYTWKPIRKAYALLTLKLQGSINRCDTSGAGWFSVTHQHIWDGQRRNKETSVIWREFWRVILAHDLHWVQRALASILMSSIPHVISMAQKGLLTLVNKATKQETIKNFYCSLRAAWCWKGRGWGRELAKISTER